MAGHGVCEKGGGGGTPLPVVAAGFCEQREGQGAVAHVACGQATEARSGGVELGVGVEVVPRAHGVAQRPARVANPLLNVTGDAGGRRITTRSDGVDEVMSQHLLAPIAEKVRRHPTGGDQTALAVRWRRNGRECSAAFTAGRRQHQ